VTVGDTKAGGDGAVTRGLAIGDGGATEANASGPPLVAGGVNEGAGASAGIAAVDSSFGLS
jgi:hypothetical protein